MQHEASPAYIGGIVGDQRSPKYVFTAALGACSEGDFDAAEGVMSYLMRVLQTDRNRILP
jgi:hypothetical protein